MIVWRGPTQPPRQPSKRLDRPSLPVLVLAAGIRRRWTYGDHRHWTREVPLPERRSHNDREVIEKLAVTYKQVAEIATW
jgi:hypothetical protein